MARQHVFIAPKNASYRFNVIPNIFTPLNAEDRIRKRGEKLSKQARLKLEWMLWHRCRGNNAALTSRHFGIAPKTFWKWKKRFNEENLSTLEEHSRTPIRKRHRDISQLQEERIIALRKTNIRYGKMKIAALYKVQYGEQISSWKAQKVIEKYRIYYHPAKQARINRKNHLGVKRKRITDLQTKETPNFLFCLDTIVKYYAGTKRYIFTAIDKYSKLAFARMYTSKNTFNGKDFLCRLYYLSDKNIANVGHDNGTEFRKHFATTCEILGITQYVSRVKTPKDNATNERFNRTLQEEFVEMGNMYTDPAIFNQKLTEWLIEYNFRRPHQSLNYLSPVNFMHSYTKPLPMYSSLT